MPVAGAKVLILIVMDNGLSLPLVDESGNATGGLNPYCNG